MRRIALAVLLFVFVLVPTSGAAANECAALSGMARLDFGNTGTGRAQLMLDGQKTNVFFVTTGFEPTGEFTADIFFDFYFPQGLVSIVEHSVNEQISGTKALFDSDIEVLSGGSGEWHWSGIANGFRGFASIRNIEGTLCMDMNG